jgi:hypothetical protein
MQEDIKNQLKLITKRIDKLAQESQTKVGFNQKTARLRLLAGLAREQSENQEISLKIQNSKAS